MLEEVAMTNKVDFFAPFAPNVPLPWNTKGGGFGYAEKAYRAWFETARRMQYDAMEFVRHRLEEDAEAVTDLGKCRTAVEAFNVQFEYARNALADFVGEGQKLAKMLGESMSVAMPTEVTNEPKRTLRKGGAHPAGH